MDVRLTILQMSEALEIEALSLIYHFFA